MTFDNVGKKLWVFKKSSFSQKKLSLELLIVLHIQNIHETDVFIPFHVKIVLTEDVYSDNLQFTKITNSPPISTL